MLVTKSTYGVTSVFKSKGFDREKLGTCTGSALERKPQTEEEFIKRLVKKSLLPVEKKEKKEKSMSRRTKRKIRSKIIAFSRLHKHLTFLTLTFVNKVEDEKGVKILGKFLDNAKKRLKDFQYLWVAEKQTTNTVFENNIHFHLITNKYWDIKKWCKYWVDLQEKNGITRRNQNVLTGSSFDVRAVTKQDIKAIGNYLTGYIVKNVSQLKCQLWNCSKKISWLKTDQYGDYSFLKKIDVLEKAKLLGGERKIYEQEYCSIHIIPLNRITMNLYPKIEKENRLIWNQNENNENNEPNAT